MAATERSEPRRALALAALVFGLTAPLTYVLQRVYERARVGVVDPTLILRSTHVDYLWRVGVATWWAGTCALVTWLTWRERPAGPAATRRLAWAAVVAGALVALLAWRRP
jgi:hypothetical protein